MMKLLPLELMKEFMTGFNLNGLTFQSERFNYTYTRVHSAFVCSELVAGQDAALEDLDRAIRVRLAECHVIYDMAFMTPLSQAYAFHNGEWLIQFLREVYFFTDRPILPAQR